MFNFGYLLSGHYLHDQVCEDHRLFFGAKGFGKHLSKECEGKILTTSLKCLI